MVFQDVQWNDIDYMDRSLDFTYDPSGFSTLPDLVKDLQRHDQHYVMILVQKFFFWLNSNLKRCVLNINTYRAPKGMLRWGGIGGFQ